METGRCLLTDNESIPGIVFSMWCDGSELKIKVA